MKRYNNAPTLVIEKNSLTMILSFMSALKLVSFDQEVCKHKRYDRNSTHNLVHLEPNVNCQGLSYKRAVFRFEMQSV